MSFAPKPKLTPHQKCERWLRENPHIYDEIVRLAREVKRAGERTGMKAIFERIRWDVKIRSLGDKWKMNNDYTAPTARIVMEREPDLEGFFATRGDSE